MGLMLYRRKRFETGCLDSGSVDICVAICIDGVCCYLWLVDVHGGCHLPLSDLALQRVQHQTRLTYTNRG